MVHNSQTWTGLDLMYNVTEGRSKNVVGKGDGGWRLNLSAMLAAQTFNHPILFINIFRP